MQLEEQKSQDSSFAGKNGCDARHYGNRVGRRGRDDGNAGSDESGSIVAERRPCALDEAFPR